MTETLKLSVRDCIITINNIFQKKIKIKNNINKWKILLEDWNLKKTERRRNFITKNTVLDTKTQLMNLKQIKWRREFNN